MLGYHRRNGRELSSPVSYRFEYSFDSVPSFASDVLKSDGLAVFTEKLARESDHRCRIEPDMQRYVRFSWTVATSQHRSLSR